MKLIKEKNKLSLTKNINLIFHLIPLGKKQKHIFNEFSQKKWIYIF